MPKPESRSYYADVPEGVDFAWCPQGCGRTTEDPYGGPCRACWREVERQDPWDDYIAEKESPTNA